MARLRARSGLSAASLGDWASGAAPAVQDSDPVRSRHGTRFRLFPQPPFLPQYRNPVTVRLSPRAGSVGPGPADGRMYVVAPIGKPRHYGIVPGPFGTPFLHLPAWDGPILPPAMPDAAGHFDHLEFGTPEFEAAHAYAAVRWVLDVWEGYLGESVSWHFAADYDALEISLYPDLNNSHAGFGFLEIGADDPGRRATSFVLNFDVVAHELGHLIIYSLLGVPDADSGTGEYQGFHESAADLVAMIAAANFEPVLDELLAGTRGNLYAANELNRFAELSEQSQIRVASNTLKMSAFRDGWNDEHDLSLPLTGAVFDALCDIYHHILIARGLIDGALARLVSDERHLRDNQGDIQARFDAAYGAAPHSFRQALYDVREIMGAYLAFAWKGLRADGFDYADFADGLLTADHVLGGGRFSDAIDSSFRWREIGTVEIGPRLSKPRRGSHLRSARTVVPADATGLKRMSYRERWTVAHGG